MKITCHQGISGKAHFLSEYINTNSKTSEGLIFVGNDLNDLLAMTIAGYSVAPSDAHPLILEHALIAPRKGGEGFVRAFIEKLLERFNVC